MTNDYKLKSMTYSIMNIIYVLEFYRFMSEDKRKELEIELKDLIEQRDKYNETTKSMVNKE